MTHAFENKMQNWDDAVKLFKQKFEFNQEEYLKYFYGGKGIHTSTNLKDWGTNSKKSLSINFTNAQTEFSIFNNGSIRILLNLPTSHTEKKYVFSENRNQ